MLTNEVEKMTCRLKGAKVVVLQLKWKSSGLWGTSETSCSIKASSKRTRSSLPCQESWTQHSESRKQNGKAKLCVSHFPPQLKGEILQDLDLYQDLDKIYEATRYRPDSPLSPARRENLQSPSTSLKLTFCPATASWNSGYFQGFFCFKILWTLPKKQLVRHVLSTCLLMLCNILDLETRGSTSLVQGKPAVDGWFVRAGTFCHNLVKKKGKKMHSHFGRLPVTPNLTSKVSFAYFTFPLFLQLAF